MNITLIVLCALFAACPICLSVGALIYGKIKLARAVKPVEYYPPRGHSPIDLFIKYYGHNRNMHALVNPIMLYWASRGFITIEEDCKRGLKLTKLKNIGPQDSKMTVGQKHNFGIEQKLFDKLFEKRNVFYTLAAESSYNNDIQSFIKACKKSANSARTKISKRLSLASYIIAFVTLVATTLTVGLGTNGGPIYMMMLFPIIAIGIFNSIPNDDSIASVIKYPFFAVWGGVPFGVLLFNIPQIAAIMLSISFISSAVTVAFTAKRIDIRTDKSIDVYGRICAFKTFLLEAEIDRLETLIEDDPTYYYDILPYCYVLKITKKLKPKFDRLALDGPSPYLGDLRDTLMF